MSKNINSKIRQRLTSHKHKHRNTPPHNQEGHDGDLLFATDNGVNKLYGKINDEWYSFGNGQKIGYKGRVNLKQSAGDQLISNLNVLKETKLHNIPVIGSDTDKFLMSDNGVIKSVTGANLRSYIGAGTGDGDITGVSITTDSGSGSKAEDTAGSADFSILGSSGVGITNSGTTITAVAVPAEIDHDSLNNFAANEHFTQANITTVGTIDTGVWQGTAIAHAYIGADAIEGDNIADNAINSEHYTDGSIDHVHLSGDAVDGDNIADDSINSEHYVDGSIDTAHIADDQVTYAKIQDMTDARMLGNNAGSDGVITEMTKANVLTFLNVADGAGVAPTNYVTNDADDTMAGTLTIDKNSTATTTANTYGALVDFDHTGICASGQTINNRAFTTVLNTNSPTHVGTLNNFGIVNSVVSGTSGTQNNYGIYNTVVSGDTRVGIYQNVTDGGTDLQFVSSADTGDYFTLATTANGATALATVDADGTSANFTADIGGSLTIEAATTVGIEAEGADLTLTSARDTNVDAGRYISLDANSAIWYFLKAGSTIAMVKESSFNLKESADAVADTAGFGQIWIHDDTPNNLYFTDDAGNDIPITNNGKIATAQNPHVFEYGGLARTQYNNWYYGASTTYGHNYYYFFGTTGSTSTPTAWIDSVPPSFLAPRDGTITGYTIIGNNRSTDTWEWMCMKGAQPTFGSAGNWTMSQIGATQSAGGTASILYKWEQTGLSVSVSKNDMLAFFFRRTTDNDSTYAYCEFSAYITME
jgi:hypothetical protein